MVIITSLLTVGTVATKESEEMNVTVLRIEHRHGTNVHVCSSDGVAQQRLWEYVQHWWGEEIKDITMPTDRRVAIDRYFEEMAGTEYYAWDDAEVDYGGNRN